MRRSLAFLASLLALAVSAEAAPSLIEAREQRTLLGFDLAIETVAVPQADDSNASDDGALPLQRRSGAPARVVEAKLTLTSAARDPLAPDGPLAAVIPPLPPLPPLSLEAQAMPSAAPAKKAPRAAAKTAPAAVPLPPAGAVFAGGVALAMLARRGRRVA